MFKTVTPESVGISSALVEKMIRTLNRRGLAMHSVLMMRGEDIFAEYYWKPFDKDFCHRMYSQTKSFVGVAIGLLEEDMLETLLWLDHSKNPHILITGYQLPEETQ